MTNTYHIPALLNETINGLNINPEGVYVDVTFGGGGHSRALLSELNEKGRLFSFDRDIDAFANANDLQQDRRWQFVHSDFRYISQFLDYYGVEKVDGILADLGVSFHHFDTAERGFSFRFAGPLDMRMNRQGGKTAADIVNQYTEEDLARVMYMYGELKQSRQIAKRIVKARTEQPIERTEQLCAVISGERFQAFVNEKSDYLTNMQKKELTLVFQALRIEVNDELGSLRSLLSASLDLLKQGGRIAVLTYHSLEDRMLKNFFRSGNLAGEIEKDFYGRIQTPFRIIEKGMTASAEEVERNPRSRSAKLRIVERL